VNALAFPCTPGSTWSWQGTRVTTQVFTASGEYKPSPGLVSLVVECIGGGGGSGGVTSPNVDYVVTGGGGGSGGYSRIALPAPLVVGGVAVTIGQGGAGAAGGVAAGETGGATSFGALCVANGGGGGQSMLTAGGFGAGGGGGAPGVGDVAFPGAAGFCGTVIASLNTSQGAEGGQGGSIFGGTQTANVGGGGALGGEPGLPNTGAGASGGVLNAYPTVNAEYGGGTGGSGVCIVTEYCVATSNNDGCGCGPARVSYGWGCE
jgi:hypothetical protein